MEHAEKSIGRSRSAFGRKYGLSVTALRIETLRRARVPEDLIGFWLGHAPRTVTDLYAEGLKRDTVWSASGAIRPDSDFRGLGYMGLRKMRWLF